MKKVFFLLAAFAVILSFSRCNKDEDPGNEEKVTDPIVGIWENVSESTLNGTTYNATWKWDVKDDNTGHYSYVLNSTIEEESDFTWSKKDSTYTFDYASATINDVEVDIFDFFGSTTLETTDGTILGTKN